jgi:hypothetical protein
MKTISKRKKARKMKTAMMKVVTVFLFGLIIFVYVYAIASAFLATN